MWIAFAIGAFIVVVLLLVFTAPGPSASAAREKAKELPPKTTPPLPARPMPSRAAPPPRTPLTPRAPKAAAPKLTPALPLDEDEVTFISNRVRIDPADLMLIAPNYIDPDAVAEPRTGGMLRAEGAFRASRGAKRERHEDAFTVLAGGVYAIADGAGGHAGGNVASRTAIDAVETSYRDGDFPRPAFMKPVTPAAERLVGALLSAHEAVRKKAKADPSLEGMGTTLLALKVDGEGERVYVAHVGDSRCYRVRNGKVAVLTKDHTVQEFAADGRGKQMLSRAIGFHERVLVDLTVGTAKAGDRFLLCTDGLYRALDELSLELALRASADLHEVAAKLVASAEARNPSDNVSLIIVDIKS